MPCARSRAPCLHADRPGRPRARHRRHQRPSSASSTACSCALCRIRIRSGSSASSRSRRAACATASRPRTSSTGGTQNDVFEAMAATTSHDDDADWTGETARLRVGRVSAGYFDVFGMRPALGRTLLADDEQPGRDRVVVLSNRIWQSMFGGRSRHRRPHDRPRRPDASPSSACMPAGSSFDRGADRSLAAAGRSGPVSAPATITGFRSLRG